MRIAPFFKAVAAAGLLLAACASPPPPPPAPTKVELTVNVAADANPDTTGRASPVTVYVYDLATEGTFNQADFFALTDQGQATLGADLLASQQVAGTPGSTQTVTTEVPDTTKFVGVIVGYRDIDRAVWRAVVPVTANQTNKVTANVGSLNLGLS